MLNLMEMVEAAAAPGAEFGRQAEQRQREYPRIDAYRPEPERESPPDLRAR